VQWNTNRKLYVAYQMAALPVPLNELEGHFLLFETFLTPVLHEKYYKFTNIVRHAVPLW